MSKFKRIAHKDVSEEIRKYLISAMREARKEWKAIAAEVSLTLELKDGSEYKYTYYNDKHTGAFFVRNKPSETTT